METKFSDLFDKWVTSIQDYYNYTERLLRIAESESEMTLPEMTFKELINFGNEKGFFIGRLHSKTRDGVQTPFPIGKGILKDGIYDVKVKVVPDFYYYNNYNNCSNEFIKGLKSKLDDNDFKGTLILFKNSQKEIEWLKKINQKKYINEFSHINDFLEIYSDMTGETIKPETENLEMVKSPIKINWTGPTTQLYWIFAQIKKLEYSDNSFNEMADFIKTNFIGISAKSKTIARDIQAYHSGDKIKKEKGSIDIKP